MEKLFEQLKEEIEELKGRNEELTGGIAKVIQENKAMQVIKSHCKPDLYPLKLYRLIHIFEMSYILV